MYGIVKNHKDFLLINKHPGVGFHKDGETEGLVEVIKKERGINELYTVHRLDKMTSGLLLFAKTRASARELSHQFRNRQIEKFYLAVSDRCPRKKQGLIKGDMGRARRGAWKLLRTQENPAITRFFSSSMGDGLRLFLLNPHTGKTHQLRVAMKSIGSPISGDLVYHKKETGNKRPDRGYLHSYALRFHLKGQVYEFIHKPDIGVYFTNAAFLRVLKELLIYTD
ncbi:MAG TPA: TIGR01621 family pseudouridine synthase [Nitrospirae bacterium]|nr:ribosomal large subunit pseudouridine synthase A [bacterium BMS3Abin06]HDH10673.1 TIGR01621 family pseudouridine synthase [Nitrospirota bacterium]HDZ01497.1 TIGR01621 family pseudouridine synthase [Nitrospirota bacterium]